MPVSLLLFQSITKEEKRKYQLFDVFHLIWDPYHASFSSCLSCSPDRPGCGCMCWACGVGTVYMCWDCSPQFSTVVASVMFPCISRVWELFLILFPVFISSLIISPPFLRQRFHSGMAHENAVSLKSRGRVQFYQITPIFCKMETSFLLLVQSQQGWKLLIYLSSDAMWCH